MQEILTSVALMLVGVSRRLFFTQIMFYEYIITYYIMNVHFLELSLCQPHSQSSLASQC